MNEMGGKSRHIFDIVSSSLCFMYYLFFNLF